VNNYDYSLDRISTIMVSYRGGGHGALGFLSLHSSFSIFFVNIIGPILN